MSSLYLGVVVVGKQSSRRRRRRCRRRSRCRRRCRRRVTSICIVGALDVRSIDDDDDGWEGRGARCEEKEYKLEKSVWSTRSV
jgi:hypothetical protein